MEYFKMGEYYISIADKKLEYMETHEDYSSRVKDFNGFLKLGIDETADTIRLVNTSLEGPIFVRYPIVKNGSTIKMCDVIEFGEGEKMKRKIKVTEAKIIASLRGEDLYYEIKYLRVGESEYDIGFGSRDVDIVIDYYNKNFEIVQEKEATICSVSPKEHMDVADMKSLIRHYEEETADLKEQIEMREKYEKIKKSADDFALIMRGLTDAGFSRDEAMMLMVMAFNTLAKPITPSSFLWGMDPTNSRKN